MMKWLKELGESRKLLGELSEGNQEITANMRQLSEQIGELSESFRMMRKENDSLFQDITEELDDLKDEQAAQIADLKKLAAGRQNTAGMKQEGSDQELIRMISLYRAELRSLQEMLKNDPAWEAQVMLAGEKLNREESAAGIFVFGKPGEAVNYEMHQVAEAVECEDAAKDRTIAHVYEEGFLIQGKLVRKAVVSAYRYTGRNYGTGNDYRN